MLGGRPFTLAVLALVAAGILVAYGNGFGIGFYFDDGHGIADNLAIRSLANVPSFFWDPYTLTAMRTNVDYRPVLLSTFALNYAVSGIDPWSYHALNMLLHFVVAAVVFVLVRDYLWWPAAERGPDGGARWPAAAAAMFFAFAPVNSQPINYMWARSSLLCTLFYLCAFFALIERRWLVAFVLHWLALLTKAIAVSLPATYLAYDYLYRERSRHPGFAEWAADWRRLAFPVIGLVVLDAAYLLLLDWILPPWVGDFLHEAWVTPWIWFVSQWTALLHYVRIFVWPVGLSVDHDFAYNLGMFTPRALASLAGILAWLGAAWLVRDRLPHVAFATLWFFLTLAPESSVSPLAEVVNDHRPYIASTLGLSVLLAFGVDRAAAVAGRRRLLVFAVASALLCVAGIGLTRHRTWEWSDGLRLWESTVRESPGNARAWMNTGLAYMRIGRYAEARTHFEKSRELNPNYAYIYMNLAVLDVAEKKFDTALAHARESVRIGPRLSRSHYYEGYVLEKMGRRAEAAEAYRRSVAIDPNEPFAKQALARTDTATGEQALMAAALALLETNDPGAAIGKLDELLKVNPDHYGARWQRARALDLAGRKQEARAEWERVLPLAQRWKNAAEEEVVRRRLAAPD